MQVIPREAKRITYSTEVRELKKVPFTDEQREVAIGCILGDSYLGPNWSKTNYLLKICHSLKQEEYVRWKYKILRKFVLTEPKIHVTTNSLRFATISHSEFTRLGNIFYRNGKKVIPENIEELLSPLALAVWFMDDGNARIDRNRIYGYYINSHSFSLKENRVLTNSISRKFGVVSKNYLNHNRYRIYIGRKENFLKFKKIIENFVLPSMRYKLG